MAIYKYAACFMTDIAKRAGFNDVTVFQSCLMPEDWVEMIRRGWQPTKKLLSPPVVQYLMDKFAPDYER